MPLWVYVVIIGIAISGFMTLYTTKKEEEIDQEFIEREGEIYLDRIRAEKHRRMDDEDDHSVML
ncbi:sporulation YhaL family protein [Ectobacillus polymachus]|uniref:sporulation YhaL family protein n=1 Tax=Ectobacillus polymachus TaxID=1508806 RepID=UPI003A8A1571